MVDNVEELMSLCSIVKVDVAAVSAEDLPPCCACPRCRARCWSPPTSATTPPSTAARRSASPTSRASTSPSRGPSSTAASPPPASARCAGWPSSTGGDISFEDLERIIASDIGLSLKLLRYVN